MAMTFTTLNDAADPTFNQDLGINDRGEIAGYFGSGTPPTVHPNKGYTLTPNYTQANYHNENFPGSNQTQVTGLNNWGLTVGFWADPNGDNFGFAEYNGHFEAIFDPNAPTPVWGTPSVQQLLGVIEVEADHLALVVEPVRHRGAVRVRVVDGDVVVALEAV